MYDAFENSRVCKYTSYFFAATDQIGKGLLIVEVSRLYALRHTPGGFFWTSDQLAADATTHTTYKSARSEHPCPQQDLNPRSQRRSCCRPVLLRPHCHRDRQAYTLILSSYYQDKSRISRLWLYSPYVTVAINYRLVVLCLKLLRHDPPNSYTRLFGNISQTVLCHSRDQQQLVAHIMLCDVGDQWQVSWPPPRSFCAAIGASGGFLELLGD